MKSVCVCFCLALLLPWCVQSQRSIPALAKLDEDTQREVLAVGVLNSLLRSEHHTVLRRARAPRPASQVPKRAQQGSRFALSLDVPTSILSVLIDLMQCVTASVSASASMTQQLLSGGAPRPRPFRVTNADRSVKKGIMANSLEDLMNKVGDSLSVPCIGALVLDEDGTGVDTEDFFQTVPENAVLMVLEKGQTWTSHPNSPSRGKLSECRPQHRTDVAKLTLDLYKNNPKDFIGCLNVKATLYGAYSVSYDLRCYAAKNMLKEALRWTIFSMQATGHILLGSSCYIEQLLEEEEQVEKSLMLPQESRIRQLQSMLLGKISH